MKYDLSTILDVPQFKILSELDDAANPTNNIPHIEVRFTNGVHDQINLKHINVMPNSKNLDSSRLCNYMGFLEKDRVKSVIAVTGCLSRKTPDEKLLITMFSDNSPGHSYFTVGIDGKVHSIHPPRGLTRAVNLSSLPGYSPNDVKRSSRDMPQFNGTIIENINDEIFDKQIEELVQKMGDVHELIPEQLKINLRFGVDTSAKSAIENQLQTTVDTWISSVFTHTMAHYQQSSLKHKITFEVKNI